MDNQSTEPTGTAVAAGPLAPPPPGVEVLRLENLPRAVQAAYRALQAQGGRILIVGGAVRDAVEGQTPKDHDLEVYGLGWREVVETLGSQGRDSEDGQSFGVIKLTTPEGDDLDISLPRRENKSGRGYRGFALEFDPAITPREAASRRDFTINSMAYDPGRGEFFDFFDGVRDLRTRCLRATGPAFGEDPERVRRGMQFAARYRLTAAPETLALCRSLLPEAATSPLSRVWGEWEKWAQKGRHPSAGLRFLRDCGWTATVPELQALEGVAQDAGYHPEGDAFEHTALVCDVGARIAERDGLTGEARSVLLFACLGHDLGKPGTTQTAPDGHIVSPGHAEAGGILTAQLLERIGAPKAIVAKVVPLVRWHMLHVIQTVPFQRRPRATVQTLAENLAPATVREWARVIEADHSGRPPLPPDQPAAAWVQAAEDAGCADGPVADLLQGRHLLAMHVEPGLRMGQVLRAARQAQVADKFRDQRGAIEWLWREGKAAHLVSGRDLQAAGLHPGPGFSRRLRLAFEAQLRGADKATALAAALAAEEA